MPRSDQGVEKSAGRYRAVPRTLSFITHGEAVLLLRGAPNKRLWPNRYNGVGGHVEAHEDIYTAAVREVREETGLDVTDVRLRGIINIDAGQSTGILVFVFTAQASQREFTPPPEGPPPEGALEWVRPDELNNLDLVPDLPQLLPRVLSMPPHAPPFFARYHYDERDQLVMIFSKAPEYIDRN